MKTITTGETAAPRRASRDKPVIKLDVAKYQHYLDDADLTPDEKRQFIEALWAVIVAFVDLGFGVDAVQQVCTDDEKSAAEIGAKGDDLLKYDYNQSDNSKYASLEDGAFQES